MRTLLLVLIVSTFIGLTPRAWGAATAGFSATPTIWSAPSTVTFTDASTGDINSWLWNFGDGTQSNQKNPVHVYATPGSYTVSLTVSGTGGTSTVTKANYVTVEERVPPGDEFLIRLDQSILQRYGLYYPVTYKFRLPSGSVGLSAQYRHWEGAWHSLPEKNSADIFNGVDAVRFDYDNGFAFVSVRFSRSSDAIYLRMVDAGGLPVPVQFDSIPRYYDERKAAATFTLDDWTSWSDARFRTASDYLAAAGLYYSVGVLTANPPWSSIQQKIDQHGDKMEVLSHSAYHSRNAAEYTANGYVTEVIGSRDAIRDNLNFAASPYLPAYLEPWGYYDATVDSLVTSGDYLLSRDKGWVPLESPFAAWEPAKGRYGRAGISFDNSNYADDTNLLAQANANFDDVLAAGSIYHLADHPSQGFWHDGGYLLQHLNHVKGRKDVWYVPFGQLYQYHFVQEMRGSLDIQHLGKTPLQAAFSSSGSTGTSPLSVSFTDTSSGSVTAWLWDFGDSTTSTSRNPAHIYTAPGSHNVTLTVTGPDGVSTSVRENYITVTTPSVSISSPSMQQFFVAPAAIPVTAIPSPGPGASVSSVAFRSGSTPLGSATTSPYGITWPNVPEGRYNLTAEVTDSLGRTATSGEVPIVVASNLLPSPWATRDIGNVGVAGKGGYLDGTFYMSGSGTDIWGAADSFRYMYQPLTGDGEIIARVVTLQDTNSWAKAGVMIRGSLAANSPHAFMAITTQNGAVFQRRLTAGGTSVSNFGPLVAAPYWVKLVRSGSTFTGYVSSNGTNWVSVGSDTISMTATVYIGLAVTNHGNTILCSTTMDRVGVTTGTPVTPPTVSLTSPASGASFSAGVPVQLAATASAGTGGTVTRVDFYAGTTLLGSDTASPYAFTWSGAAVGTHILTAVVTDSLGGTATSDPVTITMTSTAIPAPWETQDIGSIGLAGSAFFQDGLFTVRGAGADIWGRNDAFRYVYRTLTGDGEIVARVASLQNTNSWAKAGVMIRENLAANSPHALMAVTAGNGTAFQRRLIAGDISYTTAGPRVAAPYWVKLVRSGNTFSGYVSADGATWISVGSAAIPMGATVYVGLAVTSHNTGALCTATMNGVCVTVGIPVTPPTVTLTAPVDGASFAPGVPIQLAATATAGTGATVSRVDFYAGTLLLGSSTASPYSFTWSDAAVGSHILTAVVTDSLGGTATSNPVTITVTSTALPVPWETQDIGNVGLVGSASFQSGTFSLSGGGADIWGRNDGFRYVYRPLAGDGEIVARVATLQNTNSWAKAGVMIRETLAANSANALMAVTATKGAVFQRRIFTGGVTANTTGPRVAAPRWVKLVRSGDTFSGYVSADGASWALVGSDTIPMATTVYVGLAVTSHDKTALCTVTSDSVGVTAGL